jgi:hypothetical protein
MNKLLVLAALLSYTSAHKILGWTYPSGATTVDSGLALVDSSALSMHMVVEADAGYATRYTGFPVGLLA